MKFKTFAIGCGLSLALFLFAQRPPASAPQTSMGAIFDLTHAVDASAPDYGSAEKSPFAAEDVATVDKDGYYARRIALPEHFATHLDAPAHFVKGAWTVEQIPPQRLTGTLVVLDVTAKTEKNADYEVGLDDVAAWERQHGQIPAGAIVVARTGWAARWDSSASYRNADKAGTLHFPGYGLKAAQFLVESREVAALGIDTLSVDPGPSQEYPVHQYTAKHNVYHLENVANLSLLPASGATAVVAPLKLTGGSGSPVRVFAFVRDQRAESAQR
jgi:kynurenine formamidase